MFVEDKNGLLHSMGGCDLAITSSCFSGLDVVHGDYPCPVAKAADEPLGVNLFLNEQDFPLVETELVVVVTDVCVQGLHMPAGQQTVAHNAQTDLVERLGPWSVLQWSL